MDAIRGFFEERGFIEVETPTLVPSPGLDVHLSAFEVRDPAGKTVGFLATSPEYQMKRLICDGAKRIFQLGRSYRADEQGAHHEREFTILEWYRADAGSDDVIRDTEELVYTLAGVLASPVAERVKPPWPRVSVQDAFERHVGEMVDPGNEELFFRTWAEQVQPRLGIEQAEVVTHWPASMASLARLRGDGTADRFEAFVSGVELCNGFGELTDSAEQRRRFERDQEQRRDAGVPVYPIDERFLEALQRGMPPSGGNALGVDRLLMLLTEAPSIQAVMPFPAERL
jgi:lysyl-tRNA synthetase class 2